MPEQHGEDQARRKGERHAEGDEAEQVQLARVGREEMVQHATPLTRSAIGGGAFAHLSERRSYTRHAGCIRAFDQDSVPRF